MKRKLECDEGRKPPLLLLPPHWLECSPIPWFSEGIQPKSRGGSKRKTPQGFAPTLADILARILFNFQVQWRRQNILLQKQGETKRKQAQGQLLLARIFSNVQFPRKHQNILLKAGWDTRKACSFFCRHKNLIQFPGLPKAPKQFSRKFVGKFKLA